MRRYLLTKLTHRFERFLGVELPYLRAVVEHAPGAMIPIGMSMPAAGYGGVVPAPVLHMVRLGATQAQDCGECLQIAVNVARRDAVAGSDIEAAVHGRHSTLSEEYREAYLFGTHVGAGLDADELRESLRARYSERGLIELSMAAAGAQFFPVLKRGMGYARACDLQGLELELLSHEGV